MKLTFGKATSGVLIQGVDESPRIGWVFVMLEDVMGCRPLWIVRTQPLNSPGWIDVAKNKFPG